MTPVFSGRTKLAILLAKYSFARALYRHGCPFFVAEQRKDERKSAKGYNTPWNPRAQKGRGAISAPPNWSLCSSFREVMQPQLLRLRVEGTRKHGSSTQRAKADLFAVCDALRFN
jgi:hypothetical protein